MRQPLLAWMAAAGVLAQPYSIKTPGLTAPVPIRMEQPEYTSEARDAQVQTEVTLRLVIGKDGHPRSIVLERAAGFGLDERAIAAAKSWRFRPGRLAGEAVDVEAPVEVSFALGGATAFTRLVFAQPTGATRPVLTSGRVPSPAGKGKVSVRLTVDEAGRVAAGWQILQSTSSQWTTAVESEFSRWRFRPARLNGQAVAVEGEFTVWRN